MARWIALGFTLICMGSCSFVSTDPVRGIYAPLGVLLGLLVSTYLFVRERVAGAARPEMAFSLDADVQALLRKRAAEKRVQELKAKLAMQQRHNENRQQPGDGA